MHVHGSSVLTVTCLKYASLITMIGNDYGLIDNFPLNFLYIKYKALILAKGLLLNYTHPVFTLEYGIKIEQYNNKNTNEVCR